MDQSPKQTYDLSPKAIHAEMREVSWPTTSEWLSLSTVTLLLVIVCGLALYGIDIASTLVIMPLILG